jgi:hypothetical protein
VADDGEADRGAGKIANRFEDAAAAWHDSVTARQDR